MSFQWHVFMPYCYGYTHLCAGQPMAGRFADVLLSSDICSAARTQPTSRRGVKKKRSGRTVCVAQAERLHTLGCRGRFLPQLLSSPINAPLSIIPTGPKAYHPVGKSNPGGPMEAGTGATTGSPVPAGATSDSAGTKAPGVNGQTMV